MTRRQIRQGGLTLIEMLIGMVIGLVVSLAALSLYLAMNDSSRAGRASNDINETGRQALEMIGRNLQRAGFYPAQFPAHGDPALVSVIGEYFNGKAASNRAFDSGVFGCDAAPFDPATLACGSHLAGASDTIVLNHFAEPTKSQDCNRRPASADPDNAARSTASMPLFVSNRYALQTHAGGTGLACHGNGDTSTAYTIQFQGVTQLVIRYGLHSGGTASQSPDQFLSATGVDKEPTVGGVGPWQRVTAVKLCIVVRSTEPTRGDNKAARDGSLDCHGVQVKADADVGHVHKRFERVFAVRNNLTGTL